MYYRHENSSKRILLKYYIRVLWHLRKFIYSKEVISTFQNVIFREKYLWKFKIFSGTLLSASGSKSVNDINEKYMSYHFINEQFISLLLLNTKSPETIDVYRTNLKNSLNWNHLSAHSFLELTKMVTNSILTIPAILKKEL